MKIHPFIGFLIFSLLCSLFSVIKAQTPLPGFEESPYFNEQVVTFKWQPQIRVHINAPSVTEFDPNKPVGLALYALPNGNTIEQTVGKITEEGDDWHFDIQHIGAQTRFLRQKITDYNLITVYLENEQLSWPSWKSEHSNYAQIIRQLVEHIMSYFQDYQPFLVLTGHSGGGRFIFSFMDAFEQIPDYVQRICFLDSNYGYEDSYGTKMVNWLKGDSSRYISVLAYNDSVALYNGNPVVSPTGGTWYRSKMMQRYFAQHFAFNTKEDSQFIYHSTLNGRIQFFLKKNPERKILHTVQVGLNGFVHTLLTGTALQDSNYTYYGERAYSEWIQPQVLPQNTFQIPLRSSLAMTGYQFMEYVKYMNFEDREAAILKELITGNIPYFLRQTKKITANFKDANEQIHQVEYEVFPDYLSIGADSDYCRIPMGPITAQKAADFFGTTMPTRKLVDHIYQNAEIKLEPVTYAPVGNQNEKVEKFVEHNAAIEAHLKAVGAQLGQLIGGIKKDVVISNKITDPNRPNHVVIYGWHQLNGQPIQPLTNIHINTYVDYSHGIRYLVSQVLLDGQPQMIQEILKDPVQYKIFSDEAGPMSQPSYLKNTSLPEKPKSFGLKVEGNGQLKLLLQPAPRAEQYRIFTSYDGLHFTQWDVFSGNEYLFTDLPEDSILFIKLMSENNSGLSGETEVLAALPKTKADSSVLVIYGYDRSYDGNTYDFIRFHGDAILAADYTFESATNEAIENGLFQLIDYQVVDYILGNESTADETFSTNEQTLVADFLKSGGRLFVSGAEIAWDLDYKGSSEDKAFFYNYLKAQYAADAPGNVSGTYYSARGAPENIFADITQINFDNGSHGTINVKYADALRTYGGSKIALYYRNVSTYNVAGITFEGIFDDGDQPGKLVDFGFPFETVYPQATRFSVMEKVLHFLFSDPTFVDRPSDNLPTHFDLSQNFPNPFNSTTSFTFQLPRKSDVTITIFNSLGQQIRSWQYHALPTGHYQLTWDGLDANGLPVSSCSYFYRLKTRDFSKTLKMVMVK